MAHTSYYQAVTALFCGAERESISVSTLRTASLRALFLLLLELFAVALGPLYRGFLMLDGIDGIQHPVVVVLDDIVEILQEF